MDQDDCARDFYGLATTTSIYQPIHQGMPLHYRDRRRRCARSLRAILIVVKLNEALISLVIDRH
jgi:hypothetical protein